MKVVPPVAAFLLACLVVALIWAFAATTWGPRKGVTPGALGTVAVIFGLVASVAALPTLGLYVLANKRQNVTYKSAALGGFIIGAGLFVLFFSSWVSGAWLKDYAELIGMGGGLGLCGGLVFMFTHEKMSRMVSSS
ncbi:MAG: hypothetical protein AB8B82_15635 [Roseovarius sp.]